MKIDGKPKYRYCLNWHYILFGPVFYTILLFLLYRAANSGEFASLSETVHRLAHLDASDADAVEAFCGLFSVGYVINVFISFSKFKRKRVHVFGVQLLGLVVLTIVMAAFLWLIKSIIAIVVILLVLGLLWNAGNSDRTRADALSDLSYKVSQSENYLTSDQKHAIKQRVLSAALDMDKDEHDTQDIDDIGENFGL